MTHKTSFKEYCIQNQISTFLLDAAGVIYENKHVFDYTKSSIEWMQSQGDVFLASNNSFMSKPLIYDTLFEQGIDIPISHMITSGMGIEADPNIQSQLRNKQIFVIGDDRCLDYFLNGSQRSICQEINQAEALVFMSFTPQRSPISMDKIIDFVKSAPDIPVVCCNPDQWVRHGSTNYPVVGEHIRAIEPFLNTPIYWFGKPYSNFNFMALTHIQSLNPSFNPIHSLFCDDNPFNVIEMQKDTSIRGCWITDTGISADPSFQLPTIQQMEPILRVPSLNLSNPCKIY